MKNIICIMGPTAVGKSDLAMQLAEKFQLQCVSVDSAMVYRGMDIGTAKPTHAEQKRVPHALVDIRDPKDNYSVGDFIADSKKIIDNAPADKPLLFVGGTMLYYHALQFGVADIPPADKALRQQIDNWAAEAGWQQLHQRLSDLDPAAASKLHYNDKQRIQRALEVYYLTGVPISELHKQTLQSDYNFLNIVIMPQSRAELHKLIALRFNKMLELGFIAEVEALYKRQDLDVNLPSIRSIGYRQVWSYLAGEISYDAMIETAVAATRQFAKRQCTWLQRWSDAPHFTAGAQDMLSATADTIKQKFGV